MDVASLRLDSLHLTVAASKQFIPPVWAVRGEDSDNGAAIHVIKGGEVIDTLKIDDSRMYTVFGRFPSCNDEGRAVRLEHPSISRVHASILFGANGTLYVIDLGSCHGTFVSGKKVEPFFATELHDRSVVGFGQSTRCYIVRIFRKDLSNCLDDEEANTLMNCMVIYKQPSPACQKIIAEENPSKLERRVSFSCLAPEIIPTRPEPASTPLTCLGSSPEISSFRKFLPCSPRDLCEGREKSDSFPSLLVHSGSDDEDDPYSLDSSLSPILSPIDETKESNFSSSRRKSYNARFPEELCLAKRAKPEDL